jgi:hypothetical protein
VNQNSVSINGLYFLWHPGTQDLFSGYGRAVQPGRKDHLVGLLMVDRPQPVDQDWLAAVKARFGGYELYAMTARKERGIACQMWIGKQSLPYFWQFEAPLAREITQALTPLLQEPPRPRFRMHWNPALRLWTSEFQE